MDSVTGELAITTARVRVLPPAPPYTYLGIAEAMMDGVKTLAVAKPASPLALSLVAAHVLECALKAYLSKNGDDSIVKQKKWRHNLSGLWKYAKSTGLPLTEVPPHWVTSLNAIHDSPYYLRYSTGVHGIVSPGPEPMTTELEQVVAIVRSHVVAKAQDSTLL